MAKLKLVDDWKSSWKFASVQWSALGILMVTVSDVVHQTWVQIPPEVQDKIPHSSSIALVLFGLTMIGRILQIKPKELEDGSQTNQEASR